MEHLSMHGCRIAALYQWGRGMCNATQLLKVPAPRPRPAPVQPNAAAGGVDWDEVSLCALACRLCTTKG